MKKLAKVLAFALGGCLLAGSIAMAAPKVLLTEDFNSNKLAKNYVTYNGTWVVKDGIASQTDLEQGDPKKIIFQADNLANAKQITAKVRIDSWVEHDYSRAGVSLMSNVDDGYGYNMLFHQDHERVQFLDDMRAWGTSFDFAWTDNTWYWFKMKIEGDDIYGKVWKDGTAEPKDWPFVQEGWTIEREGYPAVNGGSCNGDSGSTGSFDDVTISEPEK